MMVRTQISLSAEEHRRAKRRAAELGLSLAEYVRRAVATELGETPVRADVSQLFGIGDSGGSDIATHKHEYVGDAVDAHFRARGV